MMAMAMAQVMGVGGGSAAAQRLACRVERCMREKVEERERAEAATSQSAMTAQHLDRPPDASEELWHDHGKHCSLLQHTLGLSQTRNVRPPGVGVGPLRGAWVVRGVGEVGRGGDVR